MPISKSRNVSSYVKATLKYRALRAKADQARADMILRESRLNGRQKTEALRLLNSDPALLACLAKPCRSGKINKGPASDVAMKAHRRIFDLVSPSDLHGLPKKEGA